MLLKLTPSPTTPTQVRLAASSHHANHQPPAAPSLCRRTPQKTRWFLHASWSRARVRSNPRDCCACRWCRTSYYCSARLGSGGHVRPISWSLGSHTDCLSNPSGGGVWRSVGVRPPGGFSSHHWLRPLAAAGSPMRRVSTRCSPPSDVMAPAVSPVPGSPGSTSVSASASGDDPDHLGDETSNIGEWPQSTEVDTAPPSEAVLDNIKETLSAAAQDEISSGGQASVPNGDGECDSDSSQTGNMSSRAYQLEMLDQSLKHNVIVAMDTGSGKTQVAVLRIKVELEKCPPEKMIWFLAPTISLSTQQYEVIQAQVPAASMKLLTGNNDVHTWGAPIWEAILTGVRIVVSTPQVLLDALDHAYVTMDRLALIVFDEVHNCVGKNPGGKIMTNHYHSRRLKGKSVPFVLGLTATPSMRSDIQDLEALETIMDAKCVSPTLHRDELLKCVKKPRISHAIYTPSYDYSTPTMQALHQVYVNMDIREDPYILSLRADPTERNKRALIKAVEKYDTYSQNQVKGLGSRAADICRELGLWAADLYIWKATTTYLDRVDSSEEFFDRWLDAEKKYLANTLRQVKVEPPPDTPQRPCDVSDKVNLLLQELLSAEESVVGIIFVKERAMVTMLYELLRANPRIMQRYHIGTMVGTSNHSGRRKAMYEFLGNADLKALQNFRSGKINLLIATSVLEEGIDVPACNLVICFDSPSTPKSFIQRRGRARMKDSRLVLFVEKSSPILRQWEILETEMRRIYEDEEREFRRLEMVEQSEGTSNACFIVQSTGARLDFDNAKQHLEHFCRVLSQGEYVDSRPDYIIHRHSNSCTPELSATVLLPSFVPVDLRHADSASVWKSEKNATKDAAFQAYIALYKAGLINENLLPFKFEEIPGVETRAAEVAVEPPLQPWYQAARAWRETGDKWLYSMGGFDEDGQLMGNYDILLPVWLNRPRPIQMFLDRDHRWELRLSAGTRVPHAEVAFMPDHTSTLLALHFAHRWKLEEREHVIRIIAKNAAISMSQIGCVKFNLWDDDVKQGQYLIRDTSHTPFLYQAIIPSKPPPDKVQNVFYEYEKAPIDVPYLVLTKWTRRSDFLHRLHGDPSKDQVSAKPYSRVLPLSWATVDSIHARHAQFGMLIPSIIHEIEVMLVAKQLASTLLEPVDIYNLDLVREAISSRSAAEPVHYERLEFLGDSILKFCSSVQASAQNPDWPEGYLSFFRDRLIANSRLSRAAIDNGLPKFILTKPFTGQKWRPLYLDDMLQDENNSRPERRLSTKVLADVVEALIGASYIDGGLPKAMKCISLFLDECEWQDIDSSREFLFNMALDEPLPPVLAPLEDLIGYTFRKKSLLTEAMTHASYVADTGKRSLERLEFLGDAVLDNIIVTKIFDVEPALPHHKMHTLKTAMVNGDFIAFATMEHSLRWTETIVTDDGEITTNDTYVHLWKFMRHASLSIGIEQKETTRRHQAMRDEILETMKNGNHYPWALLAHLQPKKFYSDLFEALLGAVWIDSGSMAECAALVARFGILDYLDRILRDDVHVQHPKEELGKWAVTETVTYSIDVREGSSGEREYLCKVFVGKRLVAEVDGGVSREEVKTKAATEALKVMAAEKDSGACVMVE